MCLLTFFPAGVMPDREALSNGTTFNDDGHGYAIVDVERARILTGRGMDATEMIEEFEAVRAMYPEGPAMFHSRLATDGTVNLLNCHPFEVDGDPRTVLAHNGIMPLRPGKGDPRSDTRIVAEDHIRRAYGSLRRRRARLAFQRWLTTYNKVVILTVDRRFRENAFILNEQSGTWVDGIWYSNDGYLPYGGLMGGYGSSYTYSSKGKYWYQTPITESSVLGKSSHTCWVCDATDVDWSLGECPRCGVCFDCGEMPDSCMCYMPTKVIDGPSRALVVPVPVEDFVSRLNRAST